MSRMFFAAAAGVAIVAGATSAAFAYMAAQPVLVPVAFERPMSPYAACSAEAQDQWLSGPAFDAFVAHCGHEAATRLCEDAAAAKKLKGKGRAAFTSKCVAQVEEADR